MRHMVPHHTNSLHFLEKEIILIYADMQKKEDEQRIDYEIRTFLI